jgi:hypothetical protein
MRLEMSIGYLSRPIVVHDARFRACLLGSRSSAHNQCMHKPLRAHVVHPAMDMTMWPMCRGSSDASWSSD